MKFTQPAAVRKGIILIRVVSAIVVFVQAEYMNDTSAQCVQMTEVIENITKMLDASNFGCICQEESAFEDCSVTTQHSNEQYPLRYKFAFQKNSALKSSADKVVQRLHENGIIAKLKMKYNLQKKWACPSNIAPEAKQLDLEYFTGIAFMIASLLLAATLVLLLENVVFRMKNQANNQ
ncbi:hypothetical protein CAPTEDRAFT_189591 [Capitella teleta]|uniref:Ionotropic glutamate receptor C-terminal domain-containing protein n=1 Tax=Capitella teleta TaxID=283909 RepID=R7VCW4_CAPTE|nr:hypothetical protein CAPTEDRAFT_189591 [Capitella teleta]|eukprot:ELU16479.1 hypothetical protein CAPTEDRAFT_189591 [Capitella teleta]